MEGEFAACQKCNVQVRKRRRGSDETAWEKLFTNAAGEPLKCQEKTAMETLQLQQGGGRMGTVRKSHSKNDNNLWRSANKMNRKVVETPESSILH